MLTGAFKVHRVPCTSFLGSKHALTNASLRTPLPPRGAEGLLGRGYGPSRPHRRNAGCPCTRLSHGWDALVTRLSHTHGAVRAARGRAGAGGAAQPRGGPAALGSSRKGRAGPLWPVRNGREGKGLGKGLGLRPGGPRGGGRRRSQRSPAPGCAGSCWAVLGCTGSYWAPCGSTPCLPCISPCRPASGLRVCLPAAARSVPGAVGS